MLQLSVQHGQAVKHIVTLEGQNKRQIGTERRANKNLVLKRVTFPPPGEDG